MRTFLPAPSASRWPSGTSVAVLHPGKPRKGAMVEGAGHTMFNTESIKGLRYVEARKDPVCDRSKRPSIGRSSRMKPSPATRSPSRGKLAAKNVFMGDVQRRAPKIRSTINSSTKTTIEAVVPDAKAGMSFIIVVAGGGSAQSNRCLSKPNEFLGQEASLPPMSPSPDSLFHPRSSRQLS